MSFSGLLTHRLVVERPVTQLDGGGATVVDDMGDPQVEYETVRLTRGLVQQKSMREQALIAQAGAAIGDFTIFLPIQDVRASDRLYYEDVADWGLAGYYGAGEGTRLEVTGAPRNAAGRNHHLEVDARVIASAPEELSGS